MVRTIVCIRCFVSESHTPLSPSAASKADPVEIQAVIIEAEPYRSMKTVADLFSKAQATLRDLQDKMRLQLRAALSSESPNEIGDLLLAAAPFEDTLVADIRALTKKSESLVNAAMQSMEKLARSNDFVAVTHAKEKYVAFPPETSHLFGLLNDRWDMLILEAKEALRELRASSDPRHIELELQNYAVYEVHVDDERKAVLARHDALCEEAVKEIGQSDKGGIVGMTKVYEKFAGFPTKVLEARKELKTRLDQLVADKVDLPIFELNCAHACP
eukprot:SAG31_NODE_7657_length_1626_cov_1.582842_1_plen_273_part_00